MAPGAGWRAIFLSRRQGRSSQRQWRLCRRPRRLWRRNGDVWFAPLDGVVLGLPLPSGPSRPGTAPLGASAVAAGWLALRRQRRPAGRPRRPPLAGDSPWPPAALPGRPAVRRRASRRLRRNSSEARPGAGLLVATAGGISLHPIRLVAGKRILVAVESTFVRPSQNRPRRTGRRPGGHGGRPGGCGV